MFPDAVLQLRRGLHARLLPPGCLQDELTVRAAFPQSPAPAPSEERSLLFFSCPQSPARNGGRALYSGAPGCAPPLPFPLLPQAVRVRVPAAAAEALEGSVQQSGSGRRVHGADADRRLPRHVSHGIPPNSPTTQTPWLSVSRAFRLTRGNNTQSYVLFLLTVGFHLCSVSVSFTQPYFSRILATILGRTQGRQKVLL